jgi:hypothetical protein
MEDLRPWIPMLLGVEFVRDGIAEVRQEHYILAATYLGTAMVCFALTFSSALGHPEQIAKALRTPDLRVYVPVSVLISAGLSVVNQYRGRVLLRRNALALADSLDDFAQICRARIPLPHSLPHSEFDAKQRELHDQYLDAYGEKIWSIHRALTTHNEAFRDLLDSMLGSLAVRTLRMPELATWVAKTLRLEATLLQP